MNPEWFTGTCPNCGKPDWCRQSDTGAYICRRAPAEGLEERRDKHGVPYWLYLPEGVELSDLAPNRSGLQPAAPRKLQAVYGTIIQRLRLSEKHLADWLRRGVSAEVVARHHVRSWPADFAARQCLANRLFLEFGNLMRRVPGWYIRDGRPMLSGGSGWVIPMFDLATGCVCALRIRSDLNRGSKYYWLSSADPKKGGTSPGVHARLAWPGRTLKPGDRADTVRVTEGEAKAIVLAERTGVPTLSIPGATFWTTALPWLRWLRAVRILLCFDTDRHENRPVATAYLSAARGFVCHGFAVHTEVWGCAK